MPLVTLLGDIHVTNDFTFMLGCPHSDREVGNVQPLSGAISHGLTSFDQPVYSLCPGLCFLWPIFVLRW